MSSCGFNTFVNLWTLFLLLSEGKTASGDFAAFSTKSRFNQLPGDAIYGQTIHDAKKNFELSPPRASIS